MALLDEEAGFDSVGREMQLAQYELKLAAIYRIDRFGSDHYVR
jgi:hypothetical protein